MTDPMLQYYKTMVDKIVEHGFTVQGVFPTEESPGTPFAYSVGLSQGGHPELIAYGLSVDTAYMAVNQAARLVRAGRTYSHGDIVEGMFQSDYKGVVIDIPSSVDAEMTMANNLFGEGGDSPVRAMQVIFQDRYHHWPWDEEGVILPVLGEVSDELKARLS